MTWSRFDDAAAKHPKARVAGNDAWALWVAAVMYCNRYLTDGFVPLAALTADCLPFPITPQKAKALAMKLCNARIRPDGAGLFVEVQGGYQVHDFLDWNPSKAEVEERRKKDRLRKGKTPDSGGDSRKIPRGNLADSEDPIRSDPSHTKPNQTEDARARDPSSSVRLEFTDSDEETPIPLDLVERAEKHGVFSSMLARMPGVHIDQLRDKAQSFVAYWAIGGGTGQRRRRWMSRLREDLRRAHEQGKLKPPGLLEHEATDPGPGLTDDDRARLTRRRAELDRQLEESRKQVANG